MLGVMAVMPAGYKTAAVVLDRWGEWQSLMLGALAVQVAFVFFTDRTHDLGRRAVALGFLPAQSAGTRHPLLWTFGPVGVAALGSLAALPFVDEPDKDRLLPILGLIVFTALGEELLFRSALLAVTHAVAPPAVASAITAASFGCWHVGDALNMSLSWAPGLRFLCVVATMALTAAGSYVFTWVRFRSRTLGGSVLAHVATNLPGKLLG